MSRSVSSCTPSVHACDDQVSRSELQFTWLAILASFVSRSVPVSNSFDQYQSDVIRRQTPGRESLDILKQFLFQMFGPGCGLGTDDFLQRVFAQHFAAYIFRFRESVRVGHKYISWTQA